MFPQRIQILTSPVKVKNGWWTTQVLSLPCEIIGVRKGIRPRYLPWSWKKLSLADWPV